MPPKGPSVSLRFVLRPDDVFATSRTGKFIVTYRDVTTVGEQSGVMRISVMHTYFLFHNMSNISGST